MIEYSTSERVWIRFTVKKATTDWQLERHRMIPQGPHFRLECNKMHLWTQVQKHLGIVQLAGHPVASGITVAEQAVCLVTEVLVQALNGTKYGL